MFTLFSLIVCTQRDKEQAGEKKKKSDTPKSLLELQVCQQKADHTLCSACLWSVKRCGSHWLRSSSHTACTIQAETGSVNVPGWELEMLTFSSSLSWANEAFIFCQEWLLTTAMKWRKLQPRRLQPSWNMNKCITKQPLRCFGATIA